MIDLNLSEKAIPILIMLNDLNNYHGKNYCFPSQKTILKRLEERLYVKISRRTLNRRLKTIEGSALISRTRRTRHDKVLGMVFNSTLYKISKLGYRMLARLGVLKRDTRNGEEKKSPGKTNGFYQRTNGVRSKRRKGTGLTPLGKLLSF